MHILYIIKYIFSYFCQICTIINKWLFLCVCFGCAMVYVFNDHQVIKMAAFEIIYYTLTVTIKLLNDETDEDSKRIIYIALALCNCNIYDPRTYWHKLARHPYFLIYQKKKSCKRDVMITLFLWIFFLRNKQPSEEWCWYTAVAIYSTAIYYSNY